MLPLQFLEKMKVFFFKGRQDFLESMVGDSTLLSSKQESIIRTNSTGEVMARVCFRGSCNICVTHKIGM
jgi:hypothetical protein